MKEIKLEDIQKYGNIDELEFLAEMFTDHETGNLEKDWKSKPVYIEEIGSWVMIDKTDRHPIMVTPADRDTGEPQYNEDGTIDWGSVEDAAFDNHDDAQGYLNIINKTFQTNFDITDLVPTPTKDNDDSPGYGHRDFIQNSIDDFKPGI